MERTGPCDAGEAVLKSYAPPGKNAKPFLAYLLPKDVDNTSAVDNSQPRQVLTICMPFMKLHPLQFIPSLQIFLFLILLSCLSLSTFSGPLLLRSLLYKPCFGWPLPPSFSGASQFLAQGHEAYNIMVSMLQRVHTSRAVYHLLQGDYTQLHTISFFTERQEKGNMSGQGNTSLRIFGETQWHIQAFCCNSKRRSAPT